ncbi:MAG: sensor histidine kinase, partial [Phycisphaeraceae bacterium]
DLMGLLPWLADYLVESEDLRKVQLLPLPCGWGLSGVLLHDRPNLPPWKQLGPLASAWGAAVAAAAQHEGAKRLGEELAQANSALAETQDKLLRQESLARLGEMAAGAAHEMNNPLAVISGRSQLLSMSLEPGSKTQQAAQTIFREAHRLSDLISSLRMLADPPQPSREPTKLSTLLGEVIQQVRKQGGRREAGVDISLKLKDELPPIDIDPEMISQAVRELIFNAIQAGPESLVHIELRRDPDGQAVRVSVIDDGQGMDEHTLSHALDPFFSAKPAGRRVGMGLPRVQQIVSAHHGTLELRSTAGEGTVASFTLPLDCPSDPVDTQK